jgi:chemotaxis protein methyltransferase CheR
MPEFQLSRPLATILTALVSERVGLHYDAQDTELFASKVSARALDAGFESLLDYYYYLRYDDPERTEFDALVESLLVHETYFFREPEQLKVLVDDLLVPAIRAGGQPRVWCAACSTGEEPLTLAMMLAARDELHNVEIIASDVSAKALAKAREGVYSGRSLRAITDEARSSWFLPEGAALRVRPEIHGAVHWRRLNLHDDAAVRSFRGLDAVICRNVFIYFAESTIPRVLASIRDTLKEDAALLVGASESLLRFGTLFRCEERRGTFLYRRTH